MDDCFHPTFCNECNYLSMVRSKLIHVSKGMPGSNLDRHLSARLCVSSGKVIFRTLWSSFEHKSTQHKSCMSSIQIFKFCMKIFDENIRTGLWMILPKKSMYQIRDYGMECFEIVSNKI